MQDELPCPECPAWMRLEGNRWVCAECGHRSEEVPDEEPVGEAPGPTAAELAMEQGVATSSPSYAKPAGRPRSFGVCLLLGIVTLGIYFFYWQWRVFREVHAQERNRGWSSLFLASLALAMTTAVWLFAHREPGQPASQVDGGWVETALSVAVGLAVSAYLLLETRGLDAALGNLGQPRSGAFPWLAAASAVALASHAVPVAAIAFGVAVLLLNLVGFYILQGALNRYWMHVGRNPARAAPTGLTPAAS